MTRADSNLTLAMKSGYCARVDSDGNELRRLPDGPITFTGPLTARGIPAARPVTGAAPKGNSGDQGAGESLPFVAGSPTSEAAAKAMTGPAAVQQARVLAYLRGCRYEGSTDLQGQAELGLDGDSYRPRRVKLAELGLIVPNGEERLTASGRKAVVWVAAEFAPPTVKHSLTVAPPAAVLPPIPAIPEPARVETPAAAPTPANQPEIQAELF